LVGLTRAVALEAAEHDIRVNLVAPGPVGTKLAANDAILKLYRPDLREPALDDVDSVLRSFHALPIRWLEPVDVANAVLWLASEEARYVTGSVLAVDAGFTTK
jgi:NAD(P)-dependent dehydrogenase (short-subunit alcohol dehydrogenase family)